MMMVVVEDDRRKSTRHRHSVTADMMRCWFRFWSRARVQLRLRVRFGFGLFRVFQVSFGIGLGSRHNGSWSKQQDWVKPG
ncbi:hypothetical protein Hanom_Chr01g00035301 [Helianthus anomalus]